MRLMPPIAAAVAILGIAYLALKADLDKANIAMERAAELAEDQIGVSRRVREAKLLEALATKEITQEEFNRTVAAQDAASLFEVQRANAQEKIGLIKEELALAEKLDRAAADRVLREATGTKRQGSVLAGTSETGLGGSSAKAAAEASRATVVQLRNELLAAGTALGVVTAGETRYALALSNTSDASIKGTSTGKANTDGLKSHTDALRDFNAEVDLLTAQAGFRQMATDVDAIGVALNAAISDLPSTFRSVEIELEDVFAGAIRDAMIRGAIDAAPQIANAAASGDIGQVAGAAAGAAGASNPIIAIIQAAIGALTSIGEQGVEAIEAKLDKQIGSIEKGIASLPDLAPVLARALIIDLPIAVAKGLFQALQSWWASIKDGLGNLFSPSFLKSQDGEDTLIKDIFTLDFNRSRDRGGTIQQAGFHLLHPGEEVIRSNGVGSQAGMMNRDSSGVSSTLLVTPSLFPFVQTLNRFSGAGGLREI